MKHLYKPALVLFTLFVGTALTAQVSFTNQNSLLQSTADFSVEDCAVDMNGDKLDDVVRVTYNGIYIDYQQADGSFIGEYFPMNIQNPPTWSICAADVDENGHTDLLFGNGSRVSFCFANDDGTAYTEDAHPEYIFSQRSTFSDIDNDGELDAFVCHDVDQSHPYRNDGNGNLILDQSLIVTIDVGGNYAAIWVDYDNDWDSDLYITKCRGGAAVGDPQRINLLYRNNGDGTFTEVGEETNMNDGDQSWTTVFEDFDNDGDFDAFTVNHSWANRFMENNGDGTFTDIIGTTGINANDLGAWNCDAGDFDNNGFVDIFSEMGTELYLNNGDGTFTAQDLSFDSGGIGDFNDDGFLDVINGNNLWVNNGNDNNWVKFNLEGLVSNKSAIGARIEIYGDWGIQIREVRAGESFSPMSSLSSHFGLGTATAIDEVIIKWPSGMITQLQDVEINTAHNVIEVGCMLDPTEITVNGSLTICPGETVELMADAGFDYTWSNGENSQSIQVGEAGNYSVILWQDDCAAISNTVTVEVVTEEVPTVEMDGDDVICEGTEVYLTASPGSGYEWSTGSTDQTIVVTESGEYTVTIDALCANVTLQSDPISITVMEAAVAPTVADEYLTEPGVTVLTATGENVLWYANETDVDPIAEGNELTTDWVDTEMIYWVEANTIYGGGTEQGGKEDNSGGGGLPSTGAYSYFNAWEAFTIQTVRVYVPSGAGDGVRTVQLYDGNGVMMQESTFNLTEGEHVIDLNFDVAIGNGYSLRCPENNLFRNNAGVNYPYAIGTVGELTDSFYGGSYYYYFYDWTIEKAAMVCPSERIPVGVYVVGVDEVEALASFNMFPNPTRGELTVNIELIAAHPMNFELMDVTGKVVISQQWNSQGVSFNHTLDLSDLAAGIYQFTMTIDGQRLTEKLIIE